MRAAKNMWSQSSNPQKTPARWPVSQLWPAISGNTTRKELFAVESKKPHSERRAALQGSKVGAKECLTAAHLRNAISHCSHIQVPLAT